MNKGSHRLRGPQSSPRIATFDECRQKDDRSAESGIAGGEASWRFNLAILIFALILGAVYGLTIRDGADWSEDYALYLRHAANLANGLPYDHGAVPAFATGQVLTYPVGYPLLLAAAYTVFDLDFYVFKWINVILLVLFASILVAYTNRYRTRSIFIAFLLATACMINPVLWETKDELISDVLFLLLSFLALFVYHDLRSARQLEGSERFFRMALLSLALVGAYATRAVGIVLPISIAVFELVRYRRIYLGTLLILILFAGLFLLQQFVEESFSNYVQQSAAEGAGTMFDPLRWVLKANTYRWTIAKFFSMNGNPTLEAFLLYGLILAPAAVGYVYRLVRGLTVLEVYTAGYLLIFMVANVRGYERYFLPTFVLLLIYAVEGVIILSARVKVDARYASSILIFLLLGAYGLKYSSTEYDISATGIDHPSARALFQWIERETDEESVLSAQKAYTIQLMTGRKVGQFHRCLDRDACSARNADAIWNYFKYIGASYVILKKTDWNLTHYNSDKAFNEAFIEPNREYLSLVYENSDFTVLRILGFPTTT